MRRGAASKTTTGTTTNTLFPVHAGVYMSSTWRRGETMSHDSSKSLEKWRNASLDAADVASTVVRRRRDDKAPSAVAVTRAHARVRLECDHSARIGVERPFERDLSTDSSSSTAQRNT